MIYSGDLETTTIKEDCRVWCWGLCEIEQPEHFIYGNNLESLITYMYEDINPTIYFHNLAFDGEFIISWLLNNNFIHIKDKKVTDKDKTFTTLISGQGIFYSIVIYFNEQCKTTLYNSLNILPFSVAKIAKAFKLSIIKGEIDYNKIRPIGYTPTKEEIAYQKNDVQIVAMALNNFFAQGLTKMTQGSNALSDYKKIITKKVFKKCFPIPVYDKEIRRSYKGGFTYLKPCFKDKDLYNMSSFDVNSLYPSVMYYNDLPYGEGIFFSGKYKNNAVYNIYVQQFECQFELKKNHIPTIQIKNSRFFIGNEYLETSNGQDITLTLTSVDFDLFCAHYEVFNIRYINGWMFKSTNKLFKEYIDKWIKVKNESTINGNSQMRQLAKLMLNALYGKFALNPIVQSKSPYLNDDGIVKYKTEPEEERDPIYIPVGSFITAYARYKTITSAQRLFDRFVYADTDSLHLLGTEIPNCIEVDKTKLGAWDFEGTYTRARFLRQKCYIEEVKLENEPTDKENCEYRENKWYRMNITASGMSASCYKHVTWENFHPDMEFDGKLTKKHVNGGIILSDTTFKIRC